GGTGGGGAHGGSRGSGTQAPARIRGNGAPSASAPSAVRIRSACVAAWTSAAGESSAASTTICGAGPSGATSRTVAVEGSRPGRGTAATCSARALVSGTGSWDTRAIGIISGASSYATYTFLPLM